MLKEMEDYLKSKYEKAKEGPMVEDSTLGGLQKIADSEKEPAASTDTPKGYDEGGVVPDDSVMGMDAENPDTFKLHQLQPSLPAQPTPPAPVFNPHVGMPTNTPNPNVPQVAATPMPPQTPNAANPLSQYIGGQQAQANKYGPDQQAALEKEILARQRSPGGIVGNALTGLSDSIMQGVARAGPGNSQANLQNRIDNQAKMALESQKTEHEENKDVMGQQMSLAAQDPTSSLSKSIQNANRGVLKASGATDAQIAQMPASTINEIVTHQVSLQEALARLAETSTQHTLQNNIANSNLNEKRREEEVQHPFLNALHSITGGPSTTPQAPSAASSSEITPDVSAYAAKHGITPEQALQIKMQRGGQ